MLAAWLPVLFRRHTPSLPVMCVVAGGLLFALPVFRPFVAHPMDYPLLTERLSEMVVIISLMGAGLKIDRVIGWRSWALTWRLLGIAMPVTIMLVALMGWGLLGFGLASSLLLAAVLAPTDPVLASDVQVAGPGEGKEDEARFALTSEAGLNDGLAFPFVHLAIALAAASFTVPDLLTWAAQSIVVKILIGVAGGYAIGKGLGYLMFLLPGRANIFESGDGFVALAATLLAYGLIEMVGGYGFLAVFVCALALRHASRAHAYQERLHNFAEEAERLLMMLLLVLFGGVIVHGGLLAPLGWNSVVFVGGVLMLVRPLAGGLSLVGTRLGWPERAAISFFGIRGVGSIYYLAYALNHAEFAVPRVLWGVVGAIILGSILLHGLTGSVAFGGLDRWTGRRRSSSR